MSMRNGVPFVANVGGVGGVLARVTWVVYI